MERINSPAARINIKRNWQSFKTFTSASSQMADVYQIRGSSGIKQLPLYCFQWVVPLSQALVQMLGFQQVKWVCDCTRGHWDEYCMLETNYVMTMYNSKSGDTVTNGNSEGGEKILLSQPSASCIPLLCFRHLLWVFVVLMQWIVQMWISAHAIRHHWTSF